MSLELEQTNQLTSWLTQNSIYQSPTLRTLLFSLGTAYVFTKLFKATTSILKTIFLRDQDLLKRYGTNTWAAITGASDGIGKAFAIELAHRGFNIVLIGRSLEKLQAVNQEIKELFPKTQIRIIVADFEQSYEEGFAEKLYEEVKELDISILVNNAGQGGGGPYKDMSIEKIRKMILINCLAAALIARVFLPKMLTRPNKSAMITMSSIVASFPRGKLQLYSATKAFDNFLSKGLSYEYHNNNIDIISLRPFYVSTKMIRYRQPDMRTITPQEFVNVALKQLGKTNETYGHWKHKWRGFIGDCVPEFFRPYYLKNL